MPDSEDPADSDAKWAAAMAKADADRVWRRWLLERIVTSWQREKRESADQEDKKGGK